MSTVNLVMKDGTFGTIKNVKYVLYVSDLRISIVTVENVSYDFSLTKIESMDIE